MLRPIRERQASGVRFGHALKILGPLAKDQIHAHVAQLAHQRDA